VPTGNKSGPDHQISRIAPIRRHDLVYPHRNPMAIPCRPAAARFRKSLRRGRSIQPENASSRQRNDRAATEISPARMTQIMSIGLRRSN